MHSRPDALAAPQADALPDNGRIAEQFEQIADLLELEDANPFRIRAYRNAARSIRGAQVALAKQVAAGLPLPKLPGVGEDLAEKIRSISLTGSCPLLELLRGEVPAGQTELLQLPFIGPKRVQLLHQALGIDSPADLQEALRGGRLGHLRGFGPRLREQLAKALKARSGAERRYLQADVQAQAAPLLGFIQHLPGVQVAQVAGSLRRRRDTVGDLDIVVCAEGNAAAIMQALLAYPQVGEVMASGATRSSLRLNSGLQVDVRIVGRESFGAALQYLTGSKAHSIALRRRARARGLKLNEYGVFRGAERLAGETEQSVYRALGLAWITPELRENSGEIAAAEQGRLPRLIEAADLRGDLHCHTNASDGSNSLRDMALAAQGLGWEYLAITDHSQHLRIAHGLDAERLARQLDEIDRLNDELDSLTLLKGCEVDILPDGQLDLHPGILARLDIVIGAVHSHFRLSAAEQTRRLLRAMDSPYFTILAHPGGRLLLERDACALDMQAVLRHARQRGCFLELNAQPQRLDLDEYQCRLAKEQGVLLSIASDAHRVADFALLDYGIGQARRGWLERTDVLNTRSLAELRGLLRQSR